MTFWIDLFNPAFTFGFQIIKLPCINLHGLTWKQLTVLIGHHIALNDQIFTGLYFGRVLIEQLAFVNNPVIEILYKMFTVPQSLDIKPDVITFVKFKMPLSGLFAIFINNIAIFTFTIVTDTVTFLISTKTTVFIFVTRAPFIFMITFAVNLNRAADFDI